MRSAKTKRLTGTSVGRKPGSGKRILVENVNVPGYTRYVDGEFYDAMKRALMKVLPSQKPGLSQAEMFRAVVPHLPKGLFPGGAKASWWAKTVQLDLEAKGDMMRDLTKPLLWRKNTRRRR